MEIKEQLKPEPDTLLPAGKNISEVELDQIIDFHAVQDLLNSLHKVNHMGGTITDLKGNVLSETGWQDICIKFHRVHPQTLENCVQSCMFLSGNVSEGKHSIYKCKNDMWKMVTPIFLGDKHVANLYLGQFYIEDKVPDYDAFTNQAEKYGFKKEEYLAAIKRVPRLSREALQNVVELYAGFARMISQLGNGNIKLTGALEKQKHVSRALRQLEESLQESENKFRDLSEKSLVGIYLIQNKIFKYVNPMLAEIFDYNVDDLIEKNGPDFLVLPEDIPVVRENIRKRISGMVTSSNYEFRGVKRNGEIIHVEVRGATTMYQGRPAIIGTLLDITERKRVEKSLKESEEKYRNIFENAVMGIFQLSTEGRIISANTALARILGYESPKEIVSIIIDFGLQFYVHPEQCHELFKLINEYGSFQGREVQLFRKDRSIAWVTINGRTVKDGNGKIMYYEGTIQDISDQKSLELQLRRAQKMESLGTLAGGIAHDFNNILSSLIGYTQLAIREPQNESKQDHLEQVLIACDRAKNLVRQILSFSRRSEQEQKPIDVGTVVRETLSLLRASLPTTIEFRQRITSSSTKILADPTEINQMLMNLCTNAAHAMRESGGLLDVHLANITISPDAQPKDLHLRFGPYVQLTVHDTGHGIDPAIMDRIFDPFFTTKGVGEGTGLGLSVVYGIVNNLDGAITFQSEVGKGTTFSVYLPLIDLVTPQETKKPLQDIPVGTERILFVDDEAHLVKIGEKFFQSFGYNVVAVHDSLEALQLFLDKPDQFDMVITDMTMPHVTGVELAKRFMEVRPEIPIILCTGFDDSINEEKAKAIGIRKFLIKPVSMMDIALNAREILDDINKGD